MSQQQRPALFRPSDLAHCLQVRASPAASPDPVVRVAVTSAKWSDYLKERHSEASRALGELVGAAHMRTISNASSPRYGQTSFQMRVRRRGSAWGWVC